MFRVEDKYLLSHTNMWELENRISAVLKPDLHNIDNKGYKISSLYFDDIYDTCLRDTLSGNPIRNKYRLRIYNDSLDIIKCEVKSKLYNRTLKNSKTISNDDMLSLCIGNCIESTEDSSDPRFCFNTAIKTNLLKPKVIVTYERQSYISKLGNVRITFDRNVRASRLTESFGSSDIIYDYPSKEQRNILEIKYDEYIPNYILQLLENNEMIHVSNSKYAICRQIYNV